MGNFSILFRMVIRSTPPIFSFLLIFSNLFPISTGLFGESGSNVTKLFHATCREAGVFKWAQFFGVDPPPKIWEGKNRLKFSAISDNFRV